jgi:glycosyltransferase involved in cell wall biosynthesis
MNDDVCVVVPVYNEASMLPSVLAGLAQHFCQVVCVDDGSSDRSPEIARAAGATTLRHAVNLGQGAALQTGFDYVLRHTEAKYVVTFDADGQHDPADALAMVAQARELGLDVVLGSRNLGHAEGQPLLRRLVLWAALRYTRLATGLTLSDTHNGLRVVDRRCLRVLRLQQRGMAHASEFLAAIATQGMNWGEHPVTVTYTQYSRRKGSSNLVALNVLIDLALARLRPSA